MELPKTYLSQAVADIGWIDIHAHLNMLDKEVDEALQLAQANNINRVITIGTEPEDLPIVLSLANQWQPKVFCTIGIHPHEAKKFDNNVEIFLQENLTNKRVVALGEIGLDYYYGHSEVDTQRRVFERQMELAEQFDQPVQIHTRDADDDTIEILEKFKGRVRGIIHCFTGTERLAKAALDNGFNLSFSGILTFKNAQSLRDIAKWAPLDRIHVETDSPFLAPVPMRGRKNHPAFMLWTAECLRELKGVSTEVFCLQMKNNAETMFSRLVQ